MHQRRTSSQGGRKHSVTPLPQNKCETEHSCHRQLFWGSGNQPKEKKQIGKHLFMQIF